ncbi:NAD-dependent epimerase/dehydratase family protein [Acidisphaera sp. L21]|uniref:NAD-dependent epimerase/dehydratase family protein n=1 Tax=Acidisphaera sp. L21 TaxID=1641851 RepID=UPI00234310D7|nr:NAD-dependent epimerase/dehydratase family protein [Acidisphaera sp. L21]
MADIICNRYLVTGGAGFIGSHLCNALLAAGHQVIVLDDLSTGCRSNLDSRVTFYHGSITNPAIIRQAAASVDGIFHLAAILTVS